MTDAAARYSDPFDLLLLAIAVHETATFVTADTALADFAEAHTTAKVLRV